MKKISLYSLIKDIETIAPKPVSFKEPEEVEIGIQRNDSDAPPRRGAIGKRRRIKK